LDSKQPPARVLICEDQKDAAESLAALLLLQGYNVLVCPDGRCAIDQAPQWRPDAAIIDADAALSSRYQTLLEVKGIGPRVAGSRPDDDFQRFVVAVQARHPWLGDSLARRLARAYGGRIAKLIGDAQSLADMGAEVGPGLHERELRYLRTHEWALSADDVLWRRSKLGLHYTPQQRDQVDAWMRSRIKTRALHAVKS